MSWRQTDTDQSSSTTRQTPENVEPIDVTDGSLTATREVERKDRGIAFPVTVTSENEESVAFRFEQPIPESIPETNVGFKPDEEPSEWWTEDRTVVVEERVEPSADCRFVLGLLVDQEDEPTGGWKFEPPSIEVLEVAPGGDDTASEDGLDDAVSRASKAREAISGDAIADDAESASAGDVASNGSTVATDGASDAASTQPAGPDSTPTDEDAEHTATSAEGADVAEDATATVDDSEPLIDQLVAELEEDEASEDQLAVLKDALDVEQATSDKLRLQHLQSRVEDVAAYADAMEEFLDEYGTVDEFRERFRDDLEIVEEDLDALEETVETAASGREHLESQVDDLSDRADSADDERDELESQMDELSEDVEALRNEVAELKTMRDMMAQVFSGEETEDLLADE